MIGRRSFLMGASGAGALSVVPLTLPEARALTRWDQLRATFSGTIVLPTDSAYANAKLLSDLQYQNICPLAIIYCASARDVSLALRLIQELGLPFSVRSGGHSLGGYSTSRGVVLDVSRLNTVTIGSGTATIGTGAQFVDITSTLGAAGLAIASGLHPTVAAGGFFQGGGIGLLTRSLGIASDTVTSIQLVLASGQIVTASPSQRPDLFWALRGGGGGNFGVVTNFTVATAPISFISVTTLVWSYDRAADMLDGYTKWLATAPRTIGGAARVLLQDAAPGNPPSPIVLLASVGSPAELATEGARLTALTGAPVFQQTNQVPFAAFLMGAYGCQTNTIPQCHLVGSNAEGVLPRTGLSLLRSRLFTGPISRTGWEQALAVFDTNRFAGQAHNLELVALGGAANDLPRTATAYVHRDALYTLDYVVQAPAATTTPEAIAAGRAWADAGFAAIDPYSNGETYQNFIDPKLLDWQRSYYAENYARLARIKKRVDPYRVFSFPQGIS